MKIEDILRIAYEKTYREKSRSMSFIRLNYWLVSLYPEHERAYFLGLAFIESFLDNIILLAKKRRPGSSMAVKEYAKAVVSYMRARGGVCSKKNSDTILKLSNMEFTLSGNNLELLAPPNCTKRVAIITIPPVDLSEYLLGINRYLSDLPSLIEELLTKSRAYQKANDILLSGAKAIAKGVELPAGVSIDLKTDKKGRILCVATKTEKHGPPYHKSSRSYLEGLLPSIQKAIAEVTAYRFTGYIEDL